MPMTYMAGIAALNQDYEFSLVRKAQAGDNHAMQQLLDQYEPLVNRFARNRHIPNTEVADHVQDARLSVIEAIRKFDLTRGVKLITYIHETIGFGIRSQNKTLNRDKRKIIFQKVLSLEETYLGENASNASATGTIGDLTEGPDHLLYDATISRLDLFRPLNITEQRVLWMLFERMKTREIAEALHRTTNRIAQIKNNIYKKLNGLDIDDTDCDADQALSPA